MRLATINNYFENILPLIFFTVLSGVLTLVQFTLFGYMVANLVQPSYPVALLDRVFLDKYTFIAVFIISTFLYIGINLLRIKVLRNSLIGSYTNLISSLEKDYFNQKIKRGDFERRENHRKILLQDAPSLINYFYTPLLEAFFSVIILVLLLFATFLFAGLKFGTIALGIISFILFAALRTTKKSKVDAKIRQNSSLERANLLNNSLVNLKYILANNLTNRIINLNLEAEQKFANSEINVVQRSLLQRYSMEALLFSVPVMFLLVNIVGFTLANSIVLAGLFLKSIPEVQKILRLINRLYIGLEIIKDIELNRSTISKSDALRKISDQVENQNSITLAQGISAVENGKKVQTLKFSVGRPTVIFGASGIGKTTILDQIAGVIEENIHNIHGWDKDIHYQTQDPLILSAALIENIRFISKNATDVQINSLIQEMKLNSLLDRQQLDVDVLSGGQAQRVGLIRALCCDADIILFDEPTSALDQSMSRKFVEKVERLANTKLVLIVSHDELLLKQEWRALEIVSHA
ncbi:ATP-binding cassette domain-containing protein [Planktotalea sp.]|uniref:ATP-binding cassette domain-containing protein n=1 Tax=Planktotalea sp. TaxID=2029877 RepID=UPI0025E0B31A|nr:ATP-binding cassette domain-containing protein [Planktotalea sp.]